jgi:signal transduction histidine kinase
MSSWISLERERNLSSMKTLAFASAAHEFRNPLNALVVTLDMLRPYIQEERGKRFRQIAKNCSNLMLFLIKDIMDFS